MTYGAGIIKAHKLMHPVKIIRESRRETRRELAEILGLETTRSLSHIEARGGIIPPLVLQKLSRHWHIPVKTLAGWIAAWQRTKEYVCDVDDTLLMILEDVQDDESRQYRTSERYTG